MIELRVERNADGSAGEPIERELTAEEIAAIRGTLDEAKAERLATVADIRWQRTQTFSYDGADGAPADSALTAVIGVIVGAQILPPAEPITWKLAEGEFRAWSVDQIKDYGIAIRAHVQACFDHEKALADLIAAGTSYEDFDAVDIDTGWPA